MKRLLLALAVLIAVAGSGYATGVHLAGTVDVIDPPVALAATYYAPVPVLANGWMNGRVTVGGYGVRAGVVCVQTSGGGLYGCRNITTSNSTITFWSYQTGSCSPIRSYAEVNGLGAVVSGYVDFC